LYRVLTLGFLSWHPDFIVNPLLICIKFKNEYYLVSNLYLLFEQLDLHLHVVGGLEYIHVCHEDSIYIKTRDVYHNFTEKVYKRYNDLI
jgi:hypothetical protein